MLDISPIKIKKTTQINDVEIGRLAYGCWRLAEGNQESVLEKIDTALSVSINLIDTAAIYGFGTPNLPDEGFGHAETMLGRALVQKPTLRDEIILVTKGGITIPTPYNSSASHLIASCEASLKRLQTEYVDLFLIHRPDFLTSPQEAAQALETLVQSGKARSIGVSNYSVEQTRALQACLSIPLSVIQPEISALETSALYDGTLDHAQASNLLPMAWSPLAGGALATGKPPENARIQFAKLIAELDRQAETNGTTRDIVALAWLLAHPANIIPLLGTQSPARIKSAIKAFDVQMTRRDWYAILEASNGCSMP